MQSLLSLCPACQRPFAAWETICGSCGLIFSSHAPGALPMPLLPVQTQPCPQCASPAPVGALACAACGAALVFAYTALQPGQTLAHGRYTVQLALSKGGMGAIYLATDHEAFDRTVVVKAMLDYFDPTNPQEVKIARERFLHEARTLSTLRHPAIPQIYTYFQDGPHNYIVMEYIEGHDLEQGLTHRDDTTGRLIAGQPYRQQDVLRWGVALCQALAYLASRQPHPVVHHDIKPANLLLDRNSEDIRLVDFGTAKARLLVQAGAVGLQKSSIHGTQGYAAPEQYSGQSEPRSDVYALAATLYHLATDDDPRSHPFDFPRLKQLGEFGAVLNVALNKLPDQRPTAVEFQRELEMVRAPSGPRSIEAPDGAGIPDVRALVAWCEQDWFRATHWLYGKLPDQIELWWGQTKLAHDLRELVKHHKNDMNAGLDAALALLAPNDFGKQRPQLVAKTTALDYGLLTPRRSDTRTLVVENIGRRFVQPDLALPAWVKSMGPRIVLPPGERVSVQLTAYGSSLSSGGQVRDRVLVRQGNTRLLEVEVRTSTTGWWRLVVYWRAFLRNLPRLVAAVALLSVLTMCCGGGQVIERAYQDYQFAGLYDAGVAAMERQEWDAADRTFDQILQQRPTYRDARTRSQEANYYLGEAALRRGDWDTARRVLVQADTFPGASALLEEAYNQQARQSGMFVMRLKEHDGPVQRIAFSPDGRLLASSDQGGTVRLWRVSTASLLHTLVPIETRPINGIAFSSDGQTLAVVSDIPQVTLWRVSDGVRLKVIGEANASVTTAVFSPDGKTFATSGDNAISLWNVWDGTLLWRAEDLDKGTFALAFSPDGQSLASLGNDYMIKLWRASDGRFLRNLAVEDNLVHNMAFNPDGHSIAVGGYEYIARTWRLSDGTAALAQAGNGQETTSLSFSPNGQVLVSGSAGGVINVWRLNENTTRTLVGHAEKVRSIAFSPDGQVFASGSDDGSVILWRAAP